MRVCVRACMCVLFKILVSVYLCVSGCPTADSDSNFVPFNTYASIEILVPICSTPNIKTIILETQTEVCYTPKHNFLISLDV